MQRLASSPLRQHPMTGRPGTARPQKEGGGAVPRRPMTARCASSFPLAGAEAGDRASPPKRGGGKQRSPTGRKADGTASLTHANLRLMQQPHAQFKEEVQNINELRIIARKADEVMDMVEQNRNLTNEKRRVVIAQQHIA